MSARETPLYGMDETIVAYYVAFNNANGTPNGYLVVNASVQNPSVLEFAFGTEHQEIIAGQKTIYATTGIYLSKSQSIKSNAPALKMGNQIITDTSAVTAQINQVWANLNAENMQAKSKLQAAREYIAASPTMVATYSSARAVDSWGIMTSLPSQSWSSYDELSGCSGPTPYYVMDTFKAIGSNHCGATAALNVLKYYAARIGTTLVKPDSLAAFKYLYTNTGNGGPTLPAKLLSALSSYISNRKSSGAIPSSVSISTNQYVSNYYNNMTYCINNGRMPLMNIWSGLESHWINLLGYYNYSDGNCYVRVLNNWQGDINRFYVFQTGYTVNGNIGALISARITK